MLMKIPTSYLRMTAIAVLAAGLSGCGGGGSGGPDIPTASNAAITPPPTTAVAITTGSQATNTTIASAAFQALDSVGSQTIGNASGPLLAFGVDTKPAAAETTRLTIGEILLRHAEKIKNHESSALATGAQIVQTIPCFAGGTQTFVFDDMNVNGNASEIFVNCDDGGGVTHGTISSTGVSATLNLGATFGSPYSISVGATTTIDLSITTTNPASVLVTQGSFTFSASFSGTMTSDGAGGVVPDFPTDFTTHIIGPSLLMSDGVHSEQLSNFDLTVVGGSSGTTVTGHFTSANSASVINGAVTVTITTPVHYASFALHPDAGVIEITTTASLGKIKVTFSSSTTTPVTVDVYANAADASATNTYTLTWDQFEALI